MDCRDLWLRDQPRRLRCRLLAWHQAVACYQRAQELRRPLSRFAKPLTKQNERSLPMGRRLIDISSPLRAGIASDPPYMLPEINYQDHHDTAPSIAQYMGVGI